MDQAPWQIEAEKRKQEALDAIIAAPKPSELEKAAAGGGYAAGDAAATVEMAVDGEATAAAGVTDSGGSIAKQLKKLRKVRMVKVKGKKGKLAGRKKW